jgi:hypothetical protein
MNITATTAFMIISIHDTYGRKAALNRHLEAAFPFPTPITIFFKLTRYLSIWFP